MLNFWAWEVFEKTVVLKKSWSSALWILQFLSTKIVNLLGRKCVKSVVSTYSVKLSAVTILVQFVLWYVSLGYICNECTVLQSTWKCFLETSEFVTIAFFTWKMPHCSVTFFVLALNRSWKRTLCLPDFKFGKAMDNFVLSWINLLV